MNRKRILRGLLFPPAWVLCVLPPAAFASLTAAAVRGMPDCTALYFLYGLSAYALMLWALAVPGFSARCTACGHGYARRAGAGAT